jgi:hypothetical protein
VDIVHTIDYDSSDFFKTLVRTHCRDSVSLYENVAFSKELDCLGSVLVHFVVKVQFVVKEKHTLRVLPFGPTIR